jgi:hypothetical protein
MKKALMQVFKAFFEIKEEEIIVAADVAKKFSWLAVGRIFYGVADWAIAAGLGAFVFWMEANNWSTIDVYLMTFSYDFIAAASFFFLSDMTACDFTFGKSLRRVSDSLAKHNGFWGKFFAYALLFGVSFKAIVWEGPEVICFLFQKELKKRENIWLALFALSALQGIFGAWLYTTGYKLWQKFGAQYMMDSHYVLMGIATFAVIAIVGFLAGRIAKWGGKFLRKFIDF